MVTKSGPLGYIARRASVRSTLLAVVIYVGGATMWPVARGGWGDGETGKGLRRALRRLGVIDGSFFDALDVFALILLPFLLGLATGRLLIVIVPIILASIGLAIESATTMDPDPLMPGFGAMMLGFLGVVLTVFGLAVRWLVRAVWWRLGSVRNRESAGQSRAEGVKHRGAGSDSRACPVVSPRA